MVNIHPQLPLQASKPQLRFEQRYGPQLVFLRASGCGWVFSPPWDRPAVSGQVQVAGKPWCGIRISHEKAGFLGELVLTFGGTVSDGAGAAMSPLALLRWTNEGLKQACRRITHQNELNVQLNEKNRQQARLYLPRVRACALGSSGALCIVAWLTHRHFEQPDFLRWAVGTGALGWSSGVLLFWWWYLRNWLARRT